MNNSYIMQTIARQRMDDSAQKARNYTVRRPDRAKKRSRRFPRVGFHFSKDPRIA